MFKKICLVNAHHKIVNSDLKEIEKLSKENLINYKDAPQTDDEIADIIGDSEAVLVSLMINITETILQKCKNLKYVGVCGTSLKRLDIKALEDRGITYKNVTDYCDQDTALFTVTEILKQLEKEPRQSPEGKIVGILGMGAVGVELAHMLSILGFTVLYNSRTRKSDIENEKIAYVEKQELFKKSDFISIQTPPRLEIISKDDFKQIKNGATILNTATGLVMHKESFLAWCQNEKNAVIFDSVGRDYYQEVINNKNCVTYPNPAYLTQQTELKLSSKVLENIKSFNL